MLKLILTGLPPTNETEWESKERDWDRPAQLYENYGGRNQLIELVWSFIWEWKSDKVGHKNLRNLFLMVI